MTTTAPTKPREKTFINIKATASGPKYELSKPAMTAIETTENMLQHIQQVLPTKLAELASETRLKLVALQLALATGKVEEQPE